MHKRTVFLSYAKEDRRKVTPVYRALKLAGFNPWMDAPPRPWHLDGIPVTADWDAEIRRHMSESDLVLIFLSRRSIEKKGYFQREYRLALSLAAEHPPTSLYLFPVMLEPCEVPDVTVDTVSLRRFQWYPHYRSSMSDLVSWVAKALRPKGTTQHGFSAPPSENTDEIQTFLMISESMGRDRSDSFVMRPEPSELLVSVLAALLKRDEEELRSVLWPGSLSDVAVDWDQATGGLLQINSTLTALSVAFLLGAVCLGRRDDKAGLRSLQAWLGHPLPEVGAMASFVLCQRTRSATTHYQRLESYAMQTEHASPFHRIVRHMLDRDALPSLVKHAPTMAWRIVGHDPHLAGMEMRHMSFHDKDRVCWRLTRSPNWQQREVAAAVACADDQISLSEKLPLLSDPVPRVRFRALEGILHCTDDPELHTVVSALRASPSAIADDTTYMVYGDDDEAGVVVLVTNSRRDVPKHSSFWASSTGYDIVEALDDDSAMLQAVAYVDIEDELALSVLNHAFGDAIPAWIIDCPISGRVGFMHNFRQK